MTSKITTTMQTCHLHKVWRTLVLLAMLILLPLSSQAKIYLLSIGISDYPGTRNDLRLSHNDAATMQWLYKENKQAKVCLLMNDKAKVATVKAALQKMASIATKDDIVVMFFSGHGVKGGFVCYDGFLYYNDIYSAMASCKSMNKMVFADACFSGAMRQGKDNAHATTSSNKGNDQWLLYLRLAARTTWRCGQEQRPYHHCKGTVRLCECKGEKGIRQPPASRDVGQVLQQYASNEVVKHI